MTHLVLAETTRIGPIPDPRNPTVLDRFQWMSSTWRSKSRVSRIACSQNRRCHRPRSPRPVRVAERASSAGRARDRPALVSPQRIP